MRGFAMLTIVWVHFFGGFAGQTKVANLLWGTPFSILIEGNGALSMFFVISGLVLALQYFPITSQPVKPLKLVNFYIARFLRIIPLLFFILGLSFMAFLWLYERFDTNPLPDKWKAFGWHVIQIDGHSMAEIGRALNEADEIKEQPVIIIAHTIKGKGVSFAEHKAAFHNGMLDEKQYEQACRELQN